MIDNHQRFFNYLVKTVIDESNCTYQEALEEVRRYEKTKEFKLALKKWEKVNKKKYVTYSERTHIVSKLKNIIDT